MCFSSPFFFVSFLGVRLVGCLFGVFWFIGVLLVFRFVWLVFCGFSSFVCLGFLREEEASKPLNTFGRIFPVQIS